VRAIPAPVVEGIAGTVYPRADAINPGPKVDDLVKTILVRSGVECDRSSERILVELRERDDEPGPQLDQNAGRWIFT